MLGLSLSMTLLSGCPSRKEVDAELWLNTGLPADICQKYPELADAGKFGIYRKLDTGKYEFISYCTEIPDGAGGQKVAVQGYTSINTQKLTSFLNDLLPPQSSMEARR